MSLILFGERRATESGLLVRQRSHPYHDDFGRGRQGSKSLVFPRSHGPLGTLAAALLPETSKCRETWRVRKGRAVVSVGSVSNAPHDCLPKDRFRPHRQRQVKS